MVLTMLILTSISFPHFPARAKRRSPVKASCQSSQLSLSLPLFNSIIWWLSTQHCGKIGGCIFPIPKKKTGIFPCGQIEQRWRKGKMSMHLGLWGHQGEAAWAQCVMCGIVLLFFTLLSLGGFDEISGVYRNRQRMQSSIYFAIYVYYPFVNRGTLKRYY